MKTPRVVWIAIGLARDPKRFTFFIVQTLIYIRTRILYIFIINISKGPTLSRFNYTSTNRNDEEEEDKKLEEVAWMPRVEAGRSVQFH